AQGAAAPGQGAVVDDGAQAGSDLLTDASAVGGTALAVEVTLQAVADRLVQQHPGPAGPHHHRQGTGRRGNRLQVDQRLAQRLAGIAHGALLAVAVAFEEIAVVGTSAATVAAALATAVVLDDHADVEAHQRADVDPQAAVAGGDQDLVPDSGQAHRDLPDARVEGSGGTVDA